MGESQILRSPHLSTLTYLGFFHLFSKYTYSWLKSVVSIYPQLSSLEAWSYPCPQCIHQPLSSFRTYPNHVEVVLEGFTGSICKYLLVMLFLFFGCSFLAFWHCLYLLFIFTTLFSMHTIKKVMFFGEIQILDPFYNPSGWGRLYHPVPANHISRHHDALVLYPDG